MQGPGASRWHRARGRERASELRTVWENGTQGFLTHKTEHSLNMSQKYKIRVFRESGTLRRTKLYLLSLYHIHPPSLDVNLLFIDVYSLKKGGSDRRISTNAIHVRQASLSGVIWRLTAFKHRNYLTVEKQASFSRISWLLLLLVLNEAHAYEEVRSSVLCVTH